MNKLNKLNALILSTLIAAVSLPAAAASDPGFDINGYCTEMSNLSGGSYLIEKTCRRMQFEARREVARMVVAPRSESYCRNLMSYGTAGGDYNTYKTCLKMENDARSSMQ